jgi:MFS family permease
VLTEIAFNGKGQQGLGIRDRLKKEFSFIRGNYLVLIVSWILMDIGNELPGTYYADYVKNVLGGTATILGIISFVSLLAMASGQFLGGYLADKYGRRVLVSTLTFGVALSFVFFAVAPTWHFVLIGSAIHSLCLLYQPALNAMMADSLPPEKRGMGFSILNLILSVSSTPGPIIALALVVTFKLNQGMRIAYTIVMALYLTAAIVRLRLKESIKDVEKMNLREAVRSYPKALKEGIRVWKVVPKSMRNLFFSELIMRFAFTLPQFLFLLYAYYQLQIGGTPNPALPPELDPALQQARVLWGYVMTALFMCMIFLSFPVGRLLDKIGRKKPLIVSNILVIPAILLFAYGNFLTLFIAMPLVGFAMLLGFSASQALFADLVPQTLRGKVTGSMNFFTYVLMALGGAIGGFLYDAVAPEAPFLLTVILIVPSTILILRYVHEPKPEERQA